MKALLILSLCLLQTFGLSPALLNLKSAAPKPEDNFVGVVKNNKTPVAQTNAQPPVAAGPPAPAPVPAAHPAPPPPPKEAEHVDPKTATTTSTTTATTATVTNASTQAVPPPPPQQTTVTTQVAKPPGASGGHESDTTVKQDVTTTASNGTGTTTTTTVVVGDEHGKEGQEKGQEKGREILDKLEDLKQRVEKLETTEHPASTTTYGANNPANGGTSATYSSSSPHTVNTANGPVPKIFDGKGIPHPGQVIGVSPYGVASPLVGIGAPDPGNKQKYERIDVGKALNTDHNDAVKARGVAETADQAHKDFVEENTEEFERIMSWLQEQQHQYPSQQAPKLLLQMLKARISEEEQRVRAHFAPSGEQAQASTVIA